MNTTNDFHIHSREGLPWRKYSAACCLSFQSTLFLGLPPPTACEVSTGLQESAVCQTALTKNKLQWVSGAYGNKFCFILVGDLKKSIGDLLIGRPSTAFLGKWHPHVPVHFTILFKNFHAFLINKLCEEKLLSCECDSMLWWQHCKAALRWQLLVTHNY